jgi:hypothetical protein
MDIYQPPTPPPPTIKSEVRIQQIKLRNNIGNYLMYGYGYCRISVSDSRELHLVIRGTSATYAESEIVPALSTMMGEKADKKWTNLANLPPPISFADPCDMVDDKMTAMSYAVDDVEKNGPIFVQRTFFLNCRCIRLGGIDKKLRITDDYNEPGANVWFVVEGMAINSRGEKTKAAILVNEQVDGFYPLVVMKAGGYRLSDNFTPNSAKTDFTRVSQNDKALVTMAVAHYLSNLVKR